MEEEIFAVNTTKNDKQATLRLVAIDKDYLDGFGTLNYEVNTGIEEIEQIIFSFDSEKEGMSIEKGFYISHKTSCFILCGINLAGAILDCYRKNKRNWQGFKDCLKDKGVDLGIQTLTCVSGCLL